MASMKIIRRGRFCTRRILSSWPTPVAATTRHRAVDYIRSRLSRRARQRRHNCWSGIITAPTWVTETVTAKKRHSLIRGWPDNGSGTKKSVAIASGRFLQPRDERAVYIVRKGQQLAFALEREILVSVEKFF